MNESVNRTNRATIALAIGLLILSLSTGLALGQGGTGRENTNATPKKTTPKTTTTPAKRRSNSGSSASADEIAYWNSIKNSTDPENFRAYLQQYPTGKFVVLARNRLKSLEAAKPKPAATPAATDSTSTNKTTSPSLSNLPRTRTNQTGIEFVLIPPGNFMMGSTNGLSNEKPQHQVTINYSFYMGKYEVTQAQWQALMGNSPSKFKDCGNCPVEQVSWDDAQAFINKLNAGNDGFTYRLPTEAEWEYACRAGTTGEYAANMGEMAWFKDNSAGRPHAVGGKQPNAWGLADMHGNVSEWCEDWYHETYYGAPTDGSAWLSGGEQKERVLRGSSWGEHPSHVRPASRTKSYTVRDRGSHIIGFRVVAVVRTSTNSSSTTPATVDADPFLTPPDTRNLQSGDTKSTSTADPATEKVFAGKDVDQRAQVLNQPQPQYTESARKNSVTGVVLLRAVLTSSGQVTNISVIRGLPDGLTERAIAAAKQVKFKPAMKDGKPVSQHAQFQFIFNLY